MTEVVKYSPALDAEIVADADSMEYAYQGRNQFGGVVVGIADWYIHDTITDQKIAIHEGRVYPLVGTLNTFVRHAVLGTTRDGRYRFIQQWRRGFSWNNKAPEPEALEIFIAPQGLDPAQKGKS